jgi:type III pantothenate kinase
MILADVGNTRVHLYEEGRILHLELDDALESFGERIVHYICVNDAAKERIVAESYWRDVSDRIDLAGSYPGMGADRRALCLSRGDGLYVDAGSAITLDRVEGGEYRGGAIFPGVRAWERAFAAVSPALDREPDWEVEPDTLPRGTRRQISYGIMASIVHTVRAMRGKLPLYVTGGDGRRISSWLGSDVRWEEGLVFEGMIRALGMPEASR